MCIGGAELWHVTFPIVHGRHRLNGLWDEHDVACTMRTISLETRNVHQEVSVGGRELSGPGL